MPPGTVLIVDDDAVLRRSLARALRLAGFRTDVAEGGRDALARIAAGRPDVVVLDVSMPDLSAAPRSAGGCGPDGNEVPVVMLSALDEADDRISGLQAGADDYLVKPFVTAELELRLQALLRRRPPATGVLRVGDLVVDADTRTARRGRHRTRPDPARVRPAGGAGPQRRAWCSAGTGCWNWCGATTSTWAPTRSTRSSATCAARPRPAARRG